MENDIKLKPNGEVDQIILTLIGQGKTAFIDIWTNVYRDEYQAVYQDKFKPVVGKPSTFEWCEPLKPYWRHVDRRIQALRKKSLIIYRKKAWRVA